ncbi:MAG TPA: DUF4956 domain-containing protein [Cellvibrio sp.]|nr:DUF4956 domain-containing protein [Cellvibrio sp.]
MLSNLISDSFINEPMINLAARFFIDVSTMLLLVLGIYYRRYGDKELVISAALFNIFAFAVLTILSSVQFSVTAGFGLFAILALFTLRSEQITKTEITYFFGCIAISVICSVQGTAMSLVLVTVAVVVLGAYLIDHPLILPSVNGIRITLDKIDAYALSNTVKMREELSSRLGVEVLSYQVKTIDFINDMVVINVNYRKI